MTNQTEVERVEVELDDEQLNDGRCPYCQRKKRGWRRSDSRVLCADCDKQKVGE